MATITYIACKDCGKEFTFGEAARDRTLRAGLSVPERCPACRALHRRETSLLGCSHVIIPQVRDAGIGGLGYYKRDRLPPRDESFTPLEIDSARFPIHEKIPEILKGLLHGTEQVHIVVCPTGSGKSTWLPYQMLICEELVARGPIFVTQPRIPAVEGPIKFIAEMYYGKKVEPGPGLAMGYRHSKVEEPRHDNANSLVFMTDGTTKNMIETGEVGRCSVLMIDEAHERNPNIDHILTGLRRKLPTMPHLKVLIASATVDPDQFIRFFNSTGVSACRYDGKGFTYPILQVWADEAITICAQPPPGDWEKLEGPLSETQDLEFGPAPVWKSNAAPVRYYPQFQALIGSAALSEKQSRGLLSDGPEWWAETVTALAAACKETPPPMKRGNVRDVGGNQDGMLQAAADAVVRLCVRDEEERKLRFKRYEDRNSELLFRPNLAQPAARGHVLVFVATKSHIDKVLDMLDKKLNEGELAGKNSLHPFHSDISQKEREFVQSDPAKGDDTRRIVVATNLAETSLTLPGLVYVIDTGMICESYFDAVRLEKQHPTIWHSQAGCRQRVGRVGRKEPGEAWRLYTRAQHATQRPFTSPAIERESAEGTLLSLAASGMSVVDQDAVMELLPSSTSEDAVKAAYKVELRRAYKVLQDVQALDAHGDLTRFGEELRRLQLDKFEMGPMLIEADRMACLWEMAIFLAFTKLPERPFLNKLAAAGKRISLWQPDSLQVYDDASDESLDDENDSGWENPFLRMDLISRQRNLYSSALDDLELYLRIWQGWWSQADEEGRLGWARKHGVSHQSLRSVQRTLGLRDDVEGGLLASFLPKEKGNQKRDLFFHKLDKVRWLYASAAKDQLFEARGAEFKRYQDNSSQTYKIHTESVWALQRAGEPLRMGAKANLSHFVATEKSGNKPQLRHIVWLDPKWIPDLSAFRSEKPLARARRFASVADEGFAKILPKPLTTGEKLAGLNPGDGVDVPTDAELERWCKAHTEVIAKKTLVNATNDFKVIPHGLQNSATLWKLPDGARVGLEILLDQEAINKTNQLYLLEAPMPHGMIAAKKLPKLDAPKVAGGIEPQEEAHAPSEKFSAPRARPKPVVEAKNLREILPDSLVVTAGVKNLIVIDDFHGFEAVVHLPERRNITGKLRRYISTESLRKEAFIGRECRVRVRWDRNGAGPHFDLLEWCDGSSALELRNGDTLDGKVTGLVERGSFKGYRFAPEDCPWADDNWEVGFWGPVKQAWIGRSCSVKIAGWLGVKRPKLKHEKW